MSKPAKSQWDFGELFPTEQTRKVLSVSELTAQVKRLLEKQIGQVWVTGEVTNLRAQSSGHIYFTLKDATSQLRSIASTREAVLSCVLFRSAGIAHRELLQDGQKVLLQGDVTVYEARGQYQLIVRAVELQGVGALQIAFEKLKQKLAAEGLFAPNESVHCRNIHSASGWSRRPPARRFATCCMSCNGGIRGWQSFSRHAACKAKARRRKLRRRYGC